MRGVFRGYTVKKFEECDYRVADRIVICSNRYDEILTLLEKYNVGSKISVFALDDTYYHDLSSFQNDPLYGMLNHSAKTLVEKNIRRKEFGRELQEIVRSRWIEKDMGQDYPNSVYADLFTNEELMAGDFLSAFLNLPHFEVIMRNCFGYRTHVDCGYAGIHMAKYNFPADCYPILCFLKKHVRNVVCSFDIGANRGLVSMFLSRMSDKVHAFEPSEEISNLALRDIHLNNISNIIWNECGVGSSCGKHIYYDYGIQNSGHNSFIRQTMETALCESHVDVVSIDGYCDSHDIDDIDIVKIDVEGYESDVLIGAADLINRKRIGMIIFEVSPSISTG